MDKTAGTPGGARRILVIRRDNIGDLVCTTPLFAALRVRFPDAWIGVLANSYNAPVLAGNPDIDEVFAYTKLKHRAAGQGRLAVLRQRLALVCHLRHRSIDTVILAASGRQASARRFARWIAPRRVIAAEDMIGGGHEVERTFRCARDFGITGLPPPCTVTANAALAAHLAAALPAPLAGRRLVALHISARKPRQRWPVERFAALARQLHAARGCGFLIFWSPGATDDPLHPGDDAKAAALVAQTAGLPVAAVATHHLAELVAGLSLCADVICSDGGAMHVAAGLGKPIVCFFGNSDAARWRPWGVPHVLLQPASRDVADVSVEEALAAYAQLITS